MLPANGREYYSDQRSYRGIAVRSPEIGSLGDAAVLLPKGSHSRIIKLADDQVGTTVGHCHYYTRTLWGSPVDPNTEKIRQRSRVSGQSEPIYKYDVYFLCSQIARSTITLMGVPFLRMGERLWSELDKSAAHLGLVYQSLDLRALSQALSAESDEMNVYHMTGISWGLVGDTLAKCMTMTGKDILHSKSQTEIAKAIVTSGLALAPLTSKVSYVRTHRSRFSLKMDGFGNYVFRVGKDAANLSVAGGLLRFIFKKAASDGTTSSPLKRRGGSGVDDGLRGES